MLVCGLRTLIARMVAAKPDAVYAFMPGGMGINFIKQYVAAGLSKDIQLVLPGFSADEDTIKAVGEPMLGLFNPAHWSPDLDNAESKRFVAAFEKEYGRIPSAYAAQGFDAALMMDGAIRAIKGKVEDRYALMRALKTGKYRSVRGDYKMNNNGFPIQSYYLRVVGKDAQGRIINKTMGTVFTNHAYAYYQDCKLK